MGLDASTTVLIFVVLALVFGGLGNFFWTLRQDRKSYVKRGRDYGSTVGNFIEGNTVYRQKRKLIDITDDAFNGWTMQGIASGLIVQVQQGERELPPGVDQNTVVDSLRAIERDPESATTSGQFRVRLVAFGRTLIFCIIDKDKTLEHYIRGFRKGGIGASRLSRWNEIYGKIVKISNIEKIENIPGLGRNMRGAIFIPAELVEDSKLAPALMDLKDRLFPFLMMIPLASYYRSQMKMKDKQLQDAGLEMKRLMAEVTALLGFKWADSATFNLFKKYLNPNAKKTFTGGSTTPFFFFIPVIITLLTAIFTGNSGTFELFGCMIGCFCTAFLIMVK